MKKEKIKVYIYTRVSTAMQIDGYSLDAQKSRMKAYAEFNDYEIVGEYEDAGKSGKSIEGRVEFNRMMEDIKSGKDGVSYVLVFKLSRFGRNAADVLSTLQVMQDFGVNLICVEDGIDSSKDAGKLMISVLSAVAEIERENIRVQTMEGRIQKAREGKWNGGFAPYGYKLEKGQLFINEEEAAAIRVIFDQYVHTDTGANGLAKYLATHGIHKIQRQNGKNPLFDSALIRRILKNPVYMPDADAAENAMAYLEACIAEQNSSGGVVECIISGVPAGIGDPVFEKLNANLAKAVMSIGAVKGFEIGDGFDVAKATGKNNNDAFRIGADGSVSKETNHAGGILGGMSDGSDIILRATIKPTPSISATQHTVNKSGEEIDINIKGRHDPIIVPRAVVVVESMAAITIVDAMFANMSARMDSLERFYK